MAHFPTRFIVYFANYDLKQAELDFRFVLLLNLIACYVLHVTYQSLDFHKSLKIDKMNLIHGEDRNFTFGKSPDRFFKNMEPFFNIVT